jgi:branched-chain amino acid transport system substrate-binding protein
MRKLNRRIVLAAAAGASLMGGLAFAAEPVRIGMVAPFSGAAASYGTDARQAAELAVEEINAAGGILGGRKLELVFEDNKGTPQAAVGAVQKQISLNKVDVILGGLSSPISLAETSVTKNRMLYVNAASQSDAITEQGNKWLVQINNTTSMNATAFHRYIIDTMKPKTVAFVGDNSEFSRPLLEILKKDLAAAKIELVNVSLYDNETNDYTSIITKVKSLNPDLVILSDGAPARIVQFWRQARQMGGFKAEAAVPGILTPAVLKAGDGALDGVITGDIFIASDDGPETQGFAKAFRAKYNVDPGKVHLVFYEGVKVIAGAMQKANSSTDYDAVVGAMRANSWNTPRGALRFDEKGRAHAPYFYIQRAKGTNLELVGRAKN